MPTTAEGAVVGVIRYVANIKGSMLIEGAAVILVGSKFVMHLGGMALLTI